MSDECAPSDTIVGRIQTFNLDFARLKKNALRLRSGLEPQTSNVKP